MYRFNWTTHVQKGHMSFYATILHWLLAGRRISSFLEDRTNLRSAAVSVIYCKPAYEFKDGAQTSLRKALLQDINKFPHFISSIS